MLTPASNLCRLESMPLITRELRFNFFPKIVPGKTGMPWLHTRFSGSVCSLAHSDFNVNSFSVHEILWTLTRQGCFAVRAPRGGPYRISVVHIIDRENPYPGTVSQSSTAL